MIQPLFSIITITWNAHKTIEVTLNSVADQTYKNYEYIVIDGASDDGTIDILDKNRHLINILINEPDNGLYDAMNKGLNLATGEYVIFLNAGDTFYNNKTLENIYHSIGSRTTIMEKLPYGNACLSPSIYRQTQHCPKLRFGLSFFL